MSTFIDGGLDRNRALYLLTMQDVAYRGMADNWPRPRWCKFRADGDFVFVMVWMNRACSDRFYPDPYRVIGHCDRACWNDDVSAQYAMTDRRAVDEAGQIIEVWEPLQSGGSIRVLKFAFRVDTDDLRGWFVYGECPE